MEWLAAALVVTLKLVVERSGPVLRQQPGKAMAKGPLPRLPDPHAHIESQSTPQATGTLGQPAVTTRAEAGSTEPKR